MATPTSSESAISPRAARANQRHDSSGARSTPAVARFQASPAFVALPLLVVAGTAMLAGSSPRSKERTHVPDGVRSSSAKCSVALLLESMSEEVSALLERFQTV